MAFTNWSFLIVAILLNTISPALSQCEDLSDIDESEYDFIVVGAGSAGSTVASRLSESPDTSVLLLEAGGEEDPIMNEIPAIALSLIGSDKDWGIFTEPQKSAFFWNTKKSLLYTRGKVLGGSSSLNWFLYMRGNKRDYDNWNSLVGGGWSWKDDVLPAFLKAEGAQFVPTDPNYHSTKGPLAVSESQVKNSLSDILFKAGAEKGLQMRDVNGAIQTGIMRSQNTIGNGSRCSSDKAYLTPARNRKNLRIITNAIVQKVLFSEDTPKEAIGVEFSYCGKIYKPMVGKEVILSAGSIKTPQILMLSGIGPAEQLKKFNIPIIAELPGVGENLQDHVIENTIVYVKADNSSDDQQCSTESDLQADLTEWAFKKTGPLSNPIIDVVAYVKSSMADPKDDWPDILFGFTPPATVHSNGSTLSAFKCLAAIVNTTSHGVVQLRSKDPMAPPIFDPRYLSNEADVRLFIEGVKWCLSLEKTKAFRDAGIQLDPSALAKCSNFDKSSDDFAHCVGLQDIFPGLHACGTCRMGKKGDKMAVVDSKLRVLKVWRLRVIDASIMPRIIRGTTNAAIIMIAERGADLIKKDW